MKKVSISPFEFSKSLISSYVKSLNGFIWKTKDKGKNQSEQPQQKVEQPKIQTPPKQIQAQQPKEPQKPSVEQPEKEETFQQQERLTNKPKEVSGGIVKSQVDRPKHKESTDINVPINETGGVDLDELQDLVVGLGYTKQDIERIYEGSSNEEDFIKLVKEVLQTKKGEESGQRREEWSNESRGDDGRESGESTENIGSDRHSVVEVVEGGREGENEVILQRADLTPIADTSVVPEAIRSILKPPQLRNVALAKKSLDDNQLFVMCDGTGTGKSYQQVALAKMYLDSGMKVLLVSQQQVLSADFEKGVIENDTFQKVCKVMGASLGATQGPLQEGIINFSTYENLASLAKHVDENTFVIFDESHNIRNIHDPKQSKRSIQGLNIRDRAGRVLFASATPIDEVFHIPYLMKNGFKNFGFEDENSFYTSFGLIRKGKKFVIPSGHEEEVFEKTQRYMDDLTRKGLMSQNVISLEGVEFGNVPYKLMDEQREILKKIEVDLLGLDPDQDTTELDENTEQLNDTRQKLNPVREDLKKTYVDLLPLNRTLSTVFNEKLSKERDDILVKQEFLKNEIARLNGIATALEEREKEIKKDRKKRKKEYDERRANPLEVMQKQRMKQEEFKVPHTVKCIQEELEAGRKVVVFAARVNDIEDNELGLVSPGTVKELSRQLGAVGIEDIVEIHGGIDSNGRVQARKSFMEYSSRVCIGTVESGGTGIDLDDQDGKHPRTLIIMTPPRGAGQLVQAIGRVWRLNTKSKSKVKFIFSDSDVDRREIASLVTKLRGMKAAISEDLKSLVDSLITQLGKSLFRFSVKSSPFLSLYRSRNNLFGLTPVTLQCRSSISSPKHSIKGVSQVLRDRIGRKIGEITTDSSGRQIARDSIGRQLGDYNPRSNVTYTTSGRKVGEGNLLSSLITFSTDFDEDLELPYEGFVRIKDVQEYDVKKLGNHKFGCLMAVLPNPLRKQLTDWCIENVLDCHLSEKGREGHPHVTIVYGFNDENDSVVEQIKTILSRCNLIEVKLGKFGLFKGGDDGDVLHISVESIGLKQLNEEIVDYFDVKETHSRYRPHITLAYLDPKYSSIYAEEDVQNTGSKALEEKPKHIQGDVTENSESVKVPSPEPVKVEKKESKPAIQGSPVKNSTYQKDETEEKLNPKEQQKTTSINDQIDLSELISPHIQQYEGDNSWAEDVDREIKKRYEQVNEQWERFKNDNLEERAPFVNSYGKYENTDLTEDYVRKLKENWVEYDEELRRRGSKYNTARLSDASLRAGIQLWHNYPSDMLFWSPPSRVSFWTLDEAIKTLGGTSDFSYIFFPSSGKGSSDYVNFGSDKEILGKVTDVDGKIYMYDADEGGEVFIITPQQHNLQKEAKRKSLEPNKDVLKLKEKDSKQQIVPSPEPVESLEPVKVEKKESKPKKQPKTDVVEPQQEEVSLEQPNESIPQEQPVEHSVNQLNEPIAQEQPVEHSVNQLNEPIAQEQPVEQLEYSPSNYYQGPSLEVLQSDIVPEAVETAMQILGNEKDVNDTIQEAVNIYKNLEFKEFNDPTDFRYWFNREVKKYALSLRTDRYIAKNKVEIQQNVKADGGRVGQKVVNWIQDKVNDVYNQMSAGVEDTLLSDYQEYKKVQNRIEDLIRNSGLSNVGIYSAVSLLRWGVRDFEQSITKVRPPETEETEWQPPSARQMKAVLQKEGYSEEAITDILGELNPNSFTEKESGKVLFLKKWNELVNPITKEEVNKLYTEATERFKKKSYVVQKMFKAFPSLDKDSIWQLPLNQNAEKYADVLKKEGIDVKNLKVVDLNVLLRVRLEDLSNVLRLLKRVNEKTWEISYIDPIDNDIKTSVWDGFTYDDAVNMFKFAYPRAINPKLSGSIPKLKSVWKPKFLTAVANHPVRDYIKKDGLDVLYQNPGWEKVLTKRDETFSAIRGWKIISDIGSPRIARFVGNLEGYQKMAAVIAHDEIIGIGADVGGVEEKYYDVEERTFFEKFDEVVKRPRGDIYKQALSIDRFYSKQHLSRIFSDWFLDAIGPKATYALVNDVINSSNRHVEGNTVGEVVKSLHGISVKSLKQSIDYLKKFFSSEEHSVNWALRLVATFGNRWKEWIDKTTDERRRNAPNKVRIRVNKETGKVEISKELLDLFYPGPDENYKESKDDLFQSIIKTDFGKNKLDQVYREWLSDEGWIHDILYFLPRTPNKKLGDYLLKNASKEVLGNNKDFKVVIELFNLVKPEEKELPPRLLAPILKERNERPDAKNGDFAIEARKWGLSREKYKEAEEVYVRSLEVPDFLPDKSYNFGKYKGYFLKRSDPRGIFLGEYTDCCQRPNDVGKACAYYGQSNRNSGFFVVEDTETNKILAQSWTWVSPDGLVFDNVETEDLEDEQEKHIIDIYDQAAKDLVVSYGVVNVGESGSDIELEQWKPSRDTWQKTYRDNGPKGFINALTKVGISREEAEEYADDFDSVPEDLIEKLNKSLGYAKQLSVNLPKKYNGYSDAKNKQVTIARIDGFEPPKTPAKVFRLDSTELQDVIEVLRMSGAPQGVVNDDTVEEGLFVNSGTPKEKMIGGIIRDVTNNRVEMGVLPGFERYGNELIFSFLKTMGDDWWTTVYCKDSILKLLQTYEKRGSIELDIGDKKRNFVEVTFRRKPKPVSATKSIGGIGVKALSVSNSPFCFVNVKSLKFYRKSLEQKQKVSKPIDKPKVEEPKQQIEVKPVQIDTYEEFVGTEPPKPVKLPKVKQPREHKFSPPEINQEQSFVETPTIEPSVAETFPKVGTVKSSSFEPIEHVRVQSYIKDRNALSKAKIVNKEDMGYEGVYLVKLEDGGEGILKPESEAQEWDESTGLQGTLYLREAAASEVAEILGFDDLVPPTVIRETENGFASLQRMIDGNSAENIGNMNPDLMYGNNVEDIKRAAIFDYIIGQGDRDPRNWLVTPSGKIILIDNATSFLDDDRIDIETSPFLSSLEEIKIPEYVKQFLEKWPSVKNRLVSLGLDKKSVGFVKKRIDKLVVNIGKPLYSVNDSITSSGEETSTNIPINELGEINFDKLQKLVRELRLNDEAFNIIRQSYSNSIETKGNTFEDALNTAQKTLDDLLKQKKEVKIPVKLNGTVNYEPLEELMVDYGFDHRAANLLYYLYIDHHANNRTSESVAYTQKILSDLLEGGNTEKYLRQLVKIPDKYFEDESDVNLNGLREFLDDFFHVNGDEFSEIHQAVAEKVVKLPKDIDRKEYEGIVKEVVEGELWDILQGMLVPYKNPKYHEPQIDFGKESGVISFDHPVLTPSGTLVKDLKMTSPRTYRQLRNIVKNIITSGSVFKGKMLEYYGFHKMDLLKYDNVQLEDMFTDAFDKHMGYRPIQEKIHQNKSIQSKVQYLSQIGKLKKEREGLYENSRKLSLEMSNLLEQIGQGSPRGWSSMGGDEAKAQQEPIVDSTKKLEIEKKIDELEDKISKLNKEDQNLLQEIWSFNNVQLGKILKIDNPCIISTRPTSASISDESIDKLQEAAVWMKSKVSTGVNGESLEEYEVNYTYDKRASYQSQNHSINLPSIVNTNTIIHEIGHGIESKLPGVRSVARKFLRYRVKEQKARKLNEVVSNRNFRDDEFGMDDEFTKAFGKDGAWYVGKKYESGDTEIISMGLEKLFEDPSGFAHNDPEYCAFMLGILDGSLRDEDKPEEVKTYNKTPELRLKYGSPKKTFVDPTFKENRSLVRTSN